MGDPVQPIKCPPLARDEVHAWLVKVIDQEVRAFESILSIEEQERAKRFHFARDRDRFTIARGTLRQLVGSYLNTSPAGLKFDYNEYGKPRLHEPISNLSFNLAHSGDFAVYGFVQDRPIGIDIEQIRPDFATAEIARRFFSPSEVQRFESLRPEEQHDAFFQCWSRKEAYIKAVGQGLSLPLDSFVVAFGPDRAPALLKHRAAEPPSEWTLWNLPTPKGYMGAAAIKGTSLSLRCFGF